MSCLLPKILHRIAKTLMNRNKIGKTNQKKRGAHWFFFFWGGGGRGKKKRDDASLKRRGKKNRRRKIRQSRSSAAARKEEAPSQGIAGWDCQPYHLLIPMTGGSHQLFSFSIFFSFLKWEIIKWPLQRQQSMAQCSINSSKWMKERKAQSTSCSLPLSVYFEAATRRLTLGSNDQVLSNTPPFFLVFSPFFSRTRFPFHSLTRIQPLSCIIWCVDTQSTQGQTIEQIDRFRPSENNGHGTGQWVMHGCFVSVSASGALPRHNLIRLVGGSTILFNNLCMFTRLGR